ncbi:hypothetical protein [uncultured Bacteroides sp.]|uniref:hypothetical protein n=1 Tax=uncultured Bacteroides sp. TaxID=162156 RepID=UPI002AABF16D|nr:hypothetical protein [uncultured Bacteroides sp.]
MHSTDMHNLKTIFDICKQFSSDLVNSCENIPSVVLELKFDLLHGNVVVFSTAQGDETAYPYKEKGHGLFAYFLLKKTQETKGAVTLWRFEQLCYHQRKSTIYRN